MPIIKNKETGHTFNICPDETNSYRGTGFKIMLQVLPAVQAGEKPSSSVMEMLKCPTLQKPFKSVNPVKLSPQQGDRREGIG